MSGRRKPLHPVKAKDVVKALSKLGFGVRHTKGAHVFLKHADGRTTTVPVHPREEIDRRLLRKIAADIGMHPRNSCIGWIKSSMRKNGLIWQNTVIRAYFREINQSFWRAYQVCYPRPIV